MKVLSTLSPNWHPEKDNAGSLIKIGNGYAATEK